MDHATALQVFCQPAPPGTPAPGPVRAGSPARRLRDAVEPLAMHAVWSRLVNERLAKLGLNLLTAYVRGRAARWASPPPLVAAAFAAFEPGLIAGLYEEGRRALGRSELLRVQEAATIESLHGILGGADVAESPPRCAAESRPPTARAARCSRGCGRSPGRRAARTALARLCRRARARGDSHVAAYIGAGLDPVQMNVLTELWVGYPLGSYSGTRAWGQERTDRALGELRAAGLLAGDTLTEQGRQARREIEDAQIGWNSRWWRRSARACRRCSSAWTQWGAACISAGAFPPDPRKRAAG